ncbi:GNAT family N-acetyltransferase [Ktedonospora formicarum]|uniref:Aminoglycoside N-acetyltransferase AAC(6')-Ii n=1 Tax=Ktedonospora formicarum TaxID=2778364 RepID=A0A8J3I192_9CHLR|nr:GNAT family N-acetyltransferase [Ktedonospora formicarum]GHO43059.1 aminoglycoside N-acetyltransferase AAC(6')-Ii [Ktedonospora formicarum]
MPKIRITDLLPNQRDTIEQVAHILVAGFKESSPTAWPDLTSAREEIHTTFSGDNVSLVALNEDGEVLGWIAGQSQYQGRVWELHPLVVNPQYQGQGIGRALVADFEDKVRERGAITIMLGTDDEDGRTSLSGKDLLPDLWQHIAQIQNLRHHPYEFYQKLGYTIVGVIPDANGPGKPDILMAKALRS